MQEAVETTTEGEPLFLPQGGSSDFLQRMNSVLLAIHQGLQTTPAFVAALLAHDLLEPFTFEATLGDGRHCALSGHYTVHEERLAALEGATLAKLSRAGHLQAAYMAVASMSQLQALVARMEAADAGRA